MAIQRELAGAFEDAGLAFQAAMEPFAQGAHAHEIFGMTIDDRNTGRERFTLWAGEGNDVGVVAVSRAWRQVVLHVQEPVRAFQQDWIVADEEDLAMRLAAQPGRVVWRDGHHVKVERETSAELRHLLVGMDETHGFIAQLPRQVTSVEDAHEALRPELARRQWTLRQGEWFFVPLDAGERKQVEEFLERGGSRLVRRNAALGASEWPHVVDELIPSHTSGHAFARGLVRQDARHRPLALGTEWRQVVRNLEVWTGGDVSWMD